MRSLALMRSEYLQLPSSSARCMLYIRGFIKKMREFSNSAHILSIEFILFVSIHSTTSNVCVNLEVAPKHSLDWIVCSV